MKVVIRVDASIAIGTGHVIRCRTLATALANAGAVIQFITRAHSGHIADSLSQEGFNVTLLPHPDSEAKCDDSYSDWLGVSQHEDADQTILALGKQGCDLLIVDHYGICRVWEEQLKSHARQILVIDDLANREHLCDFLLDQNFVLNVNDRYRDLVPTYCKLLIGTRYALLRPEYAEQLQLMPPRRTDVNRILVYMGGSDQYNITGKILEALSAKVFINLYVDIVIGQNYLFQNELIQKSKARPNTIVHRSQPHLADLMAKADFAIGAGGATSWERLCLGLPSLVISTADNQIPSCLALEAADSIFYLGANPEITVASIESSLSEALASPKRLQIVSSGFKIQVDGLGVDRVLEVLNPTDVSDLKIRLACHRDMAIYFAWVNDPRVRLNAININPIALDNHLSWFEGRLSDKNVKLFILFAGRLPVGQIRFEMNGAIATIDYSLDEVVRGRGWANQLLKLGINSLNQYQIKKLKATVKINNIASAAAFIRMGFIERQLYKDDGYRYFELSNH